MKRIQLNILSIICIVLVFVACDPNLLDTTNPNEPTADTFWQTEDQAVKAINSVYSILSSDGMYQRYASVLQDFRSDAVDGDSPAGFMDNVGRFIIGPDHFPTGDVWAANYSGIFRANQVLANVPDMDIDEDLKSRIIGEAHFLRGLFYWHLVNLWRNVPLITEVPENAEDYNVPQAPPEEVWTQIFDDFQAAKDRLPTKDQYGGGDIGRATWGAATGFLGKAHLYQGEWEDARDEFQEIIQGQGYNYELVDDYRSLFDGSNENSEESLFEVQFSNELLSLGGQTNLLGIVYAPEGFGWSDALPTEGLVNAFDEESTINGNDDPRKYATMFYNRPGMTVYGSDYEDQYGQGNDRVFWRKYMKDTDGGNEHAGEGGINYILMRYADILLMYAEAQNELNNQDVAAEYIQDVRDRANLPDREAQLESMSQEQLRDEIAHERFVELALEGHRFHDLRRWGWLEDQNKLQILRQHDGEFDNFTDIRRQWLAIPQSELDVNPNLDQNEGY